MVLMGKKFVKVAAGQTWRYYPAIPINYGQSIEVSD